MTETKLELDVEDLTVLIFSTHNCQSIAQGMIAKGKSDGSLHHVSDIQFNNNHRMLIKLLKMYEQLTGDFFPHRL